MIFNKKNIILIIILLLLIILLIIHIKNKKHFLNHSNIEGFSNFNINNDDTYILPKIIYLFWDDLNTSLFIRRNLELWKKYINPSWKINIITRDNVINYVDEDFMKKYEKLDNTRFSDFLRVYLLIKTGGLWMDPSCLILKPKFIDDYYDEMIKYKYDVCLFEFKDKTENSKFPYLENWFIMAKKDSKLLKDLYFEFDKSFQLGFEKYKKTYLRKNDFSLKQTIDSEDDTYLMQHAIIHYLFYQNRKYNINIKNADESMMSHYSKFDSDRTKFKNYLLNLKNLSELDNLYGIKLTGSFRKEYNDNETNILFDKLDKYINRENKKYN
jgi:hypothetical protein